MPLEKDVFNFCPICGGDFKTSSDISKKCSKCGYVYFISANPCAGGIVVNESGHILLIKRKNDPYKGTWDIPAGFVDGLETFEEALKREMKEEIGIDISNYQYFKSYSGEYENKRATKYYLTAMFIIQINDETVINIGDDAGEYKFVDPENINYDEISFESTKQALRDYINSQKQ